MAFSISVPTMAGGEINEQLECGEAIFILGPNGAGKSTLMWRIGSLNQKRDITQPSLVRRISAHRQTWFSPGGPAISFQQRDSLARNIRVEDFNMVSRHQDGHSSFRAPLSILNLLDQEAAHDRQIRKLVQTGDIDAAQLFANEMSPLDLINQIAKQSNLDIRIEVSESHSLRAIRSGQVSIDAAEMSDGERSAFLVAAEVLTAPASSLILIDEPERHLHRSISVPLLKQLFSAKSDCAFVISTHDVDLALEFRESKHLLLRRCEFDGVAPKAWDADFLDGSDSLDEEARRAVLGGRRKVLFVEGESSSLDTELYSVVFPGVSVVSQGNCRAVELMVTQLRKAKGLHWVRAWGIVDRDDRSAAEIECLRKSGVFAVPFYSVEALIYHPEIYRRLAERNSKVIGGDPAEMAAMATRDALGATEISKDVLTRVAYERRGKERFMKGLPGQAEFDSAEAYVHSVDLAAIKAQTLGEFDALTKGGDLVPLLSKYPLRRSGALTAIAKAIGFSGRKQYELAAMKLFSEDADAANFVKGYFGDLSAEIIAA